MAALTARVPATAPTVQRRMAPRLKAAPALTSGRGCGLLSAAAAAAPHTGSGPRSAAVPASSGSGMGSKAANEAGPAPVKQAAWWAPLTLGIRAAVRLLLAPSLPLLTPCLALAACARQQPLAAAVLLAAQPLLAFMASHAAQLAMQAQIDVEGMCRTKPVAQVIAELRSESEVLSQRWERNKAARVLAVCMSAVLAAFTSAMLTAAQPFAAHVHPGQSLHYLGFAAGCIALSFLSWYIRPAAKDALHAWMLRDLMAAAERLQANEAQGSAQP